MKIFSDNPLIKFYLILLLSIIILIFLPDIITATLTDNRVNWKNTIQSLGFNLLTGLVVAILLSFIQFIKEKYFKGGRLQTAIELNYRLKKENCFSKCIESELICQKLYQWELYKVTDNRYNFNEIMQKFFVNAEKSIDIIAFGLSRSREINTAADVAKSIKDRNIKIRLICPYPYSHTAEEQDRFEASIDDRSSFSCTHHTKETINGLLGWVNQIQTRLDDGFKNNIDIVHYNELPLFFYMRIDNDLYVGPYILGRSSKDAITFHFRNGGKGFEYFTKYFEMTWKFLSSDSYIENEKTNMENAKKET